MTLTEIRTEYNRRYANESYAGDEQTENLFRILDAAEKLSPSAQAEFCSVFTFENAIDGEVYLGGKVGAKIRFPNLLAEGTAAGLTLVTR